MEKLKNAFANLSPRLMGLLVGFMWLWNNFYSTVNYLKIVLENAADEALFYEAAFDYKELIIIAVEFIIGTVVGIGLVKNHPKIIIAGMLLSIADIGFYAYEIISSGYPEFISIVANGISLFSLILIVLSLLLFRKGFAKFCFWLVAIMKIGFSCYWFFLSLVGTYVESFSDLITDIIFGYSASGMSTSVSFALVMLYVFILISYEKDDCAGRESSQAKGYIDLEKHLLLSLVTFGIWFLIWVYRTTKTVNEISKDGKQYNPSLAVILHIVPFYSFYWNYTQTKRLENELIKSDETEAGIGLFSLAVHIFDLPYQIYIQDKINKYILLNITLHRKDKN